LIHDADGIVGAKPNIARRLLTAIGTKLLIVSPRTATGT
jgi:hypothetical protein